MQLTIGFSPCPNDTFIFDALIHHKIDTEGIQFTPVLHDVEALNLWAIEGRLDITKLSYGVLPVVTETYSLLDSGSALGKGVGPLLISYVACSKLSIAEQRIAIPGENTTAHLLFSLRYPDAKNKIFLRYDAIEDFVLQGMAISITEYPENNPSTASCFKGIFLCKTYLTADKRNGQKFRLHFDGRYFQGAEC